MTRFFAIAVFLFFSSPVLVAQIMEGEPFSGKRELRPFVETFTERIEGYSGWGFRGGAGTEFWMKHFTASTKVTIDTADKADTHSGTALRLEGACHTTVSRHVFLGGGGQWGTLITSAWSKQSASPFLGGGYGDRDFTLMWHWYFAGTDRQNGTRGWKAEAKVPLYGQLKHKFYYDVRFARYTAYETDCPTCARTPIHALETGFIYRW